MRQLLGVLAKDVPRYARNLMRTGTPDYLRICNRAERLESGPDGVGFRCDWKWGSDLHAPKHLPFLGRWLMTRALADHPIDFQAQPSREGERPDITFIVGHRGSARLPHLLSTLASIAAQRGAVIECLVVEQEFRSRLKTHLPAWVRHVHTPPPDESMGYCRSWAFNIGARHARGDILVLHDNDMLVPQDYGACLLARFREGFDMVDLKRFVFYLTERHTAEVLASADALTHRAPEAITQNLAGGGSLAVKRDAYERVGGMDESFIGWGGEDNEFYERLGTLRVWPYANLALVHLWHPPQPGKQHLDNPTRQRLAELSLIPAAERIRRLRQLDAGNLAGPTGWRASDSPAASAAAPNAGPHL